jgi:hypothetical protein
MGHTVGDTADKLRLTELCQAGYSIHKVARDHAILHEPHITGSALRPFPPVCVLPQFCGGLYVSCSRVQGYILSARMQQLGYITQVLDCTLQRLFISVLG